MTTTHASAPPHPGHFIIHGFMIPHEITLSKLAKAMDISAEELRELLYAEVPCTPELAAKLAVALDTQEEFWLSSQRIYDAWLSGDSENSLAAN